MALQVSFRVVGLYCYFENLQLDGVEDTSSVESVMQAVHDAKSDFSFTHMDMDGKQIVNSMSYTFGPDSTTPYNTSGTPPDGKRSLSISLGTPSVIWQYYRSVTGTLNGTVCEIKLLTRGQPSFSDTALNYYDPFFGAIPPAFDIHTYNLTWRLVQIQMSPQNQAKFMAAHAKFLNAAK
ncbi:MAG: hypothetical protein AAGG75_05030 [Bacteroidota bacterium]